MRGFPPTVAGELPLRILLFYDCIYPGSVGGVEHRNYELARALGERGHEVTLAGFALRVSHPFPGVRVMPVGAPGTLYRANGRRSRFSALRLAWGAVRVPLAGFDVVEAANIPYAHLWPLALRCRARRIPLVVSWYEYWGGYWRRYMGASAWRLYATAERACANLGVRAIASSELTAARLRRRRGRGPVDVISIGIDVGRVRASTSQGEPGSAPPLVYAGRLMREKRIDLLLEALVLLRSRWPGPLLTLIGDGPDRTRLQGLVAESGLREAVVFTGRLPEASDVWRLLGRSRIAVQPSSREGYGIFPLEAMVAGLPVVYCESPDSALPELVHSGIHGIAVAPEPTHLATALDTLLRDRATRDRMGEAARSRADLFDWVQLAARLETVYYEARDYLADGSK